MFSGLRRSFRIALLLVAAVFVVAACSSDGFPVSYDDQVDEQTGLSNIESNWLVGCVPGLGEELADEATGVCECSYARIRTDVPFEAFLEFNGRMNDNPRALTDQYADPNSTGFAVTNIVRDCIASA